MATTTGANPFPADALETNRAGQLTTAQRDRFRPIARYTRQNTFIAAVILAVAAAMMVSDKQLSLPAVLRMPLAGAFVILALFFLVRAAVGGDALSRDLRHARVQAVDGAIGRRAGSYSARGGRRTYWLDVGDGTYRVSRVGYDAAPEAGMVRVYFLPRSRRVVNLERLPDAPLGDGIAPRDVLASMGAAIFSGRHRELNEIRARAAPVIDAVNAARDEPAVPPPLTARDRRPLAQAILGTWTSTLMTVTFEANGTMTGTLFGGVHQRGRWSVDGAGRLLADVTGQGEAADAWVVGDELTISAVGTTLRFTRR
jgi:hypothetical protein